MASKVLTFLKDREGQAVTVQDMMDAQLAPSLGTLMTYLSKLARDPSSGVTRLGLDKRTHGVNRPYRYDAPVETVRMTLRVIGSTEAGYLMAQATDGQVYEVRPLGKLGATAP